MYCNILQFIYDITLLIPGKIRENYKKSVVNFNVKIVTDITCFCTSLQKQWAFSSSLKHVTGHCCAKYSKGLRLPSATAPHLMNSLLSHDYLYLIHILDNEY